MYWESCPTLQIATDGLLTCYEVARPGGFRIKKDEREILEIISIILASGRLN